MGTSVTVALGLIAEEEERHEETRTKTIYPGA
jgi:hypothetical protein